MAKWKTKAYKKKSLRERRKIELGRKGVESFGKLPKGREGAAFDSEVGIFIREGSCRH